MATPLRGRHFIVGVDGLEDELMLLHGLEVPRFDLIKLIVSYFNEEMIHWIRNSSFSTMIDSNYAIDVEQILSLI